MNTPAPDLSGTSAAELDDSPLALTESPQRFFNRELSWLAFNERVLGEAADPSNPLFERLRFLSISASNLDEFYMVRVAGLRQQANAGIKRLSQDGLTPVQQIDRINERAGRLMADQQKLWNELRSAMHNAGVAILDPNTVTSADTDFIRDSFMEKVFPLLTPSALDPSHPFPFVPNTGFVLGFRMRRRKKKKTSVFHALVPLPAQVSRFMPLPADGGIRRLISLEDMITVSLDALFPQCEPLGRCAFRVIRDTDIAVEEEAEDLVREFETRLRRRRRGKIVRVKMEASARSSLKEFFATALGASAKDVVEVDGILGVAQLLEIIDESDPKGLYPQHTARFPERIREHDGDCFAAIRKKDILVHHPYESFDVVAKFLRQAATDPDVAAIRQTLYRTSGDSPIVSALVEAAEEGKNVTALIELKARFNEETNIRLARVLERAGVHVVYGFLNRKVHAKVSQVVRREDESLVTYTHFGTGNYHPVTARIYTDLSLFTADEAIGRDAVKLFNYITGCAKPRQIGSIVLSPVNLRSTLVELIEDEIAHARAGRPAVVWAKMNALVDQEIIDILYRASAEGVKIHLIVRGICCLRPGVANLSENISVRSVIGRFLEHSRIVCFGAGSDLPSTDAKVFISSADWMPRNFDARVEIMVPVHTPTVHRQILDQIMVANMIDQVQSWYLDGQGDYARPPRDKDLFSCHRYFMDNPSLSGRGSALDLARPPHLKPASTPP